MRTCSLSFGIIIIMTFMHTFSFSILGPFLLAFCVKPRVFILYTIYLSLHCHHQNDSCIKVGCDESDESHFNVSVGSHKTMSTDHNLFEEKGEPTR